MTALQTLRGMNMARVFLLALICSSYDRTTDISNHHSNARVHADVERANAIDEKGGEI